MKINNLESLKVLPILMRSIREISGFNQAEVAEDLGTSRQMVSYWESGESTPNQKQLAIWLVCITKKLELMRDKPKISNLLFENFQDGILFSMRKSNNEEQPDTENRPIRTFDQLGKQQNDSDFERGRFISTLIEKTFLTEDDLSIPDSRALFAFKDKKKNLVNNLDQE